MSTENVDPVAAGCQKAVREAAENLRGVCDTVLILAELNDPSCDTRLHCMCGSAGAAYVLAKRWCLEFERRMEARIDIEIERDLGGGD